MTAHKIETMTLQELQDEKRRLIKRLAKTEDATWNDAKRFKMCCDAIRYIHEMRNWASDMNKGKASEHQVSNRMPASLSDNGGFSDRAN